VDLDAAVYVFWVGGGGYAGLCSGLGFPQLDELIRAGRWTRLSRPVRSPGTRCGRCIWSAKGLEWGSVGL